MLKKIIVVSAVNLVNGGPLTVLSGCLSYLSANLSVEYEIIALVNKKDLFSLGNIRYLEFPQAKKTWFNRLYYEYYYFGKLARELNPFLWLSLHDMTPNVKADRLAVYCHNASPFYRLSFKEAAVDPMFALFNAFYKYLYRINIKKNDFVIVQQEWLRKELIKLYKLKNIIVAHPEIYDNYLFKDRNDSAKSKYGGNFVFFYPALPRVFKNFEVVCKASERLLKQGIDNFKVIFTISGTENQYAKNIHNSFKRIENIKFLGIQDREAVFDLYANASCLIFPSKLETWGLPITEFKKFNKPILLADLAYAHETLGMYDKSKFFQPDEDEQLAEVMKSLMDGTIIFDDLKQGSAEEPFSQSWEELFDFLLSTN